MAGRTTKTVSIPWAPLGAPKSVFVRFNGGGANLDKLEFVAPAGVGKNLVSDSDFEQGTKGGFFTWASGAIANTTARAVSGTHSLALTGRTDNSPVALGLTGLVAPGKTYKVSLWATIGGARVGGCLGKHGASVRKASKPSTVASATGATSRPSPTAAGWRSRVSSWFPIARWRTSRSGSKDQAPASTCTSITCRFVK